MMVKDKINMRLIPNRGKWITTIMSVSIQTKDFWNWEEMVIKF